MSKKVIFLVGLPGSGKTHYAGGFPGYTLLDDPSVFVTHESLLKFMADHGDLIISDPMLCREWTQVSAKAIFSRYAQRWIYWENDLEACLNNIHKRNDDRHISLDFMKALSRQYFIPDGVAQIPVFRKI